MICAFDTGWLCLLYAENSACRCCVDSYIFPYHLPNSELPRLSIMQCDKCRCIWGQTNVLVLLGMIGKCGKKIIKNKRGKLANQSRWGRGGMGTCLGSRFGACARVMHTWTKSRATRWSTGWIRVSGLFWILGLKDTKRESVCVCERERERERMYVSVCG